MTEQENVNLGMAIGVYIISSIAADIPDISPRFWNRMQAVFGDQIQETTGIPAEDYARMIDRISGELKQQITAMGDADG